MEEKHCQSLEYGSPCDHAYLLSWFNSWVAFAPDFQCSYFCESSCLFYLRFNFDIYGSKIMHLWARNFTPNRTSKCLRNQGRTKGEGCSTAN